MLLWLLGSSVDELSAMSLYQSLGLAVASLEGSNSPSTLWGLLRQPREVATHIDHSGLEGFCHARGVSSRYN